MEAHAPHPDQRLTARLFRAHAAADVVLRQHGQVRFQFLLEVAIEIAGPEERAEPSGQFLQSGHHPSPPGGELQHASDDP